MALSRPVPSNKNILAAPSKTWKYKQFFSPNSNSRHSLKPIHLVASYAYEWTDSIKIKKYTKKVKGKKKEEEKKNKDKTNDYQ